MKTMKRYCVICNTANKNSGVRKTKQKRLMLASNITVCYKEKPIFTKNQEVIQQTFIDLQDVLETSSRHLQKVLEDVFETSWKIRNCYAENAYQTSSRHPLKMSWTHVLQTFSRNVFKTSSRYVLKLPFRLLWDQQRFKGKESLSVSNKPKSISDKYLSTTSIKSKTTSRQIQDALIRKQ